MNSKKISNAKSDDQIRQLYESAFPEDEQIPWKDLMRLIGEMPLDFTAYYDGEEFIGFTIVYPRKSFNWFWYFAVREELRGQGYGQQILTQLIAQYKGQTFVLDMESPTQVCENISQRKRRHAFYLRNGFRDTNVYRTYRSAQRDACQSKNDITMTIMMMGERQRERLRVGERSSGMGDGTSGMGSFTMKDWDDIIRELQQFWWPDDIKEDDMME